MPLPLLPTKMSQKRTQSYYPVRGMEVMWLFRHLCFWCQFVAFNLFPVNPLLCACHNWASPTLPRMSFMMLTFYISVLPQSYIQTSTCTYTADTTDCLSTACTPDELAAVVREIRDNSGLIRSHTHHLVSYKNCFIGRDLVTWLVEKKGFSCEYCFWFLTGSREWKKVLYTYQ